MQGRPVPGSDGHPPSPLQSGSLCSALNGAMQGLHVQGGSSEMSGLPQTQLDDSSMQSGSLGGPQGAPRLRSAGTMSPGQSTSLEVPSISWESQMSVPEGDSVTTPLHIGRSKKRHSPAGSLTVSAASQQRRSKQHTDCFSHLEETNCSTRR